MLSQLQMTDYASIRPVFGSTTVEIGVAYYSYPGSGIDISHPEYYAVPSYALTSKFTIGATAYYAPGSRPAAGDGAKLRFEALLIRPK